MPLPTAQRFVRRKGKKSWAKCVVFLEIFRAPKQAFFQHLCAIIRKKFRALKQKFSGRLSKQFVRHSVWNFVRHYTEKIQGAKAKIFRALKQKIRGPSV